MIIDKFRELSKRGLVLEHEAVFFIKYLVYYFNIEEKDARALIPFKDVKFELLLEDSYIQQDKYIDHLLERFFDVFLTATDDVSLV